jgi:hypothetical protein
MQRYAPDIQYTSIQINRRDSNRRDEIAHRDTSNFGESCIIGLGEYSEGKLMLEDNHSQHEEIQCATDRLKTPNETIQCRLVDIKQRLFPFNGKELWHMPQPHKRGTRYTVVFFTIDYAVHAQPRKPHTKTLWSESQKELSQKNFNFQRSRPEQATMEQPMLDSHASQSSLPADVMPFEDLCFPGCCRFRVHNGYGQCTRKPAVCLQHCTEPTVCSQHYRKLARSNIPNHAAQQPEQAAQQPEEANNVQSAVPPAEEGLPCNGLLNFLAARRPIFLAAQRAEALRSKRMSEDLSGSDPGRETPKRSKSTPAMKRPASAAQ